MNPVTGLPQHARHGRSRTREYRNAYTRRYERARQARAISLLGGRCALCGNRDDLEIDHIDNGGYRDRKARGARAPLLDVLNGVIAPYQVLCRCCNHLKCGLPGATTAASMREALRSLLERVDARSVG